MFLFSCCQSVESGRGYQIKRKNSKNEVVTTFVQTLNDLRKEELKDPSTTILKVEKSQYDALIAQYQGTNRQWTDPLFPPDKDSLGKIDDIQSSQWKRISNILTKPALFDGKIEPKDVIQGSLGDCYFLSALAALAEKQQRIKQVFGNQDYNQNGIYKVTIRIDGIIQEILVDDYIPVNTRGQPLFCQPNKNQFWVLILQKAWAKAHGSYANIVAGNPTEVFKAVTYAPAEMSFVKDSEQEREKLWRTILEQSVKDYPCCCGSDDREDIDWDQIGIVPGHAYTLINARTLQHKNGKHYRMLKLRNPWGDTEWTGEGCQQDKTFWKNIVQNQDKASFLSNFSSRNDGIFYITYYDFCKYFSQIHFCMMHSNGNYISEQLYTNGKNGSIYCLMIEKTGEYTFQIHQSGMRGEDPEKSQDGYSRATILIAKDENKKYTFIDGALKYNDQDATLKCYLEPGQYLFYAKLDRTRIHNKLPEKSSVSVYSVEYTELIPSQQQLHPDFLKKLFLSHAQNHKRSTHNNGEMWISWKLLFQQGGYAYIAFGNSSKSDKKFLVSFDQTEFNEMNFKLKKNFKGKEDKQLLQVLPGEQKIILARVMNVPLKSLKFPPSRLGIKTQKLH